MAEVKTQMTRQEIITKIKQEVGKETEYQNKIGTENTKDTPETKVTENTRGLIITKKTESLRRGGQC